MKKMFRVVILLIRSRMLFAAGHLYHGHVLVSEPYLTTRPLSPGENGVLPAVITVYDDGGPDELPCFVLFAGTKALDTLKPQGPVGGWKYRPQKPGGVLILCASIAFCNDARNASRHDREVVSPVTRSRIAESAGGTGVPGDRQPEAPVIMT